ncbi:aminodeoxychorismate synthase component I [Macrococcus brunensis]|uniref:aminodeoxychorismate synthase component I n=1 Tax=Macrococcus brunensis TaxID=198483 RepID=UPI001EF13066|nr:aminodeoxychorismate synthase component I [Macrococcus brunensis]ULG74757.1 aminodeoxychorismate synthase component I [Macrococcus brunensis]
MRACIQFKEFDTLYFEEPLQVLTANTLDEVKPVIDAAEKWSKANYVVGYLNYEAAKAFSPLMAVKEADCYAKFYVFSEPARPFEKSVLRQPVKFAFTETKEMIEDHIREIKERIRLGDTYQVNYTTRLKATADVDAYALYLKLTEVSNGGYCAFIEEEDHAIISISPELFFKYDRASRVIQTKPMKGTLSRHQDPLQDKRNFEQLKSSEKDQAENVMIVDLLRNDLSRIAEKNSVQVPALFDIEAYPTVYQMTSTVEAVIKKSHTLYDVLKALFPCGSITGAPKISTMNIINGLESARGIYCGTIGILTPEQAVFNVPIRTIEKKNNQLLYGVGGGMTIDSDETAEFNEMVMKTHILRQLAHYSEFNLIETMRLDATGIRRREYHFNRLLKSLTHFDFAYDSHLLQRIFEQQGDGSLRIAAYDGYISVTKRPLPTKIIDKALLTPMEEVSLERLQHKTSQRNHYTSADGFLSLYYNKNNYLTEFNIGNLVYSLDGTLYTPALEDQLPGSMQAELLATHQIKRRDLHLNELDSVEQFWMINSLREWVKVELCKQNVAKF